MISRWMFVKYLYLIMFFFTKNEAQEIECTYATSKKYIGYYRYQSGRAYIEPYVSFLNLSDEDVCFNECMLNDQCYAASYALNSVCSFYNTSNFIVWTTRVIQIHYGLWVSCNMSEGHQPQDGRCRGLWITYDNYFANVSEYQNLGTSNLNQEECKDQCLANPLCGFVMRNIRQCILIPKWPYFSVKIIKAKDWSVDKWTCVDHFVDNLEIRKEESQPNTEKCTGYWTISRRNYNLAKKINIWLSFHTQIYTDCFEECNRYSNCSKVFYNVTYSLCILYHIKGFNGIRFSHDILVIVFDWICVRNDSQRPAMNEIEKRYLYMGMNCYRIISTEDLYIGRDECGRYPSISRFVKCTGIHYKNEWDITDSCLVNQSYWAFPTETVFMNDTDGHPLWNVTKIFTGLQIYWLAHLNAKNFLSVAYLECRSFNASRPLEVLKEEEIISRNKWHSLSPIRSLPLFIRKPNKFLVSASQSPYYSCKTRAACTDILRWIQIVFFHGSETTKQFPDLPYNFMIDDYGHIYEGRGWTNQCGFAGTSNSETICVAYIGWFKFEMPGERFIKSLKKLIEFAVDHDHLMREYILYIPKDLGKNSVHRNLAIVIKNWYRYRGFLPDDCSTLSLLVIGLNILSFLVIVLLLKYFYGMLTFAKCCHKCAFLSGKNIKLKQVVHDMNTPRNSFNHNLLIYEKSNWISGRGQSQIIKLIKLWFYNIYLEGSNSYFSGNSLYNFLNTMQRSWDDVVVFEADRMITEEGKLICSKIIICVAHVNMIIFLKSLLKNGSCICRYFKIEPISTTTLSFKINITD